MQNEFEHIINGPAMEGGSGEAMVYTTFYTLPQIASYVPSVWGIYIIASLSSRTH